MAKKEKKTEELFKCLSVTLVKVFPFREAAQVNNMLGLAEVVLNDQLVIRGLRIKKSENGMFVNYPNDPFYNGEDRRSIVLPITRELREHIENCVLEKYLYETEKAGIKFEVELTHKELSGAALQMEIIASSDKQAESKAIEKAIGMIPSTKDNGEWTILKVTQHDAEWTILKAK